MSIGNVAGHQRVHKRIHTYKHKHASQTSCHELKCWGAVPMRNIRCWFSLAWKRRRRKWGKTQFAHHHNFFFFFTFCGSNFPFHLYPASLSSSLLVQSWLLLLFYLPLTLLQTYSIFLCFSLFLSDFSSSFPSFCWYSLTAPTSYLFQYCSFFLLPSFLPCHISHLFSVLSPFSHFSSFWFLSIHLYCPPPPPLCSFRPFPGQAAWPLQPSTSFLFRGGGICLWPFPPCKKLSL